MGKIPPWSDLPTELLSTISNFLTSNPLDIASFRCVCKSWSSSSSSSSDSPLKLSPPLPLTIPVPPYTLRNPFSTTLGISYSILSITRVYFLRAPIGSHSHFAFLSTVDHPKGWILFVDQSTPGKVTIRRPFSNSEYSLPLNFPQTLDLLSFQAREISRFCNVNRVSEKDGKITRSPPWSGVVRKVVLFSSASGLVVVALSGEGKLGLLRLGLGDMGDKDNSNGAEWSVIHDGKGFRFDDIVDFRGVMLGIDRRGRVYQIETGCCSSSPIAINPVYPPIFGGGGKRKRLVESLGCLYLVVRGKVRHKTDPIFRVYELREGAKKWVEVNSLGGRTFFLGLEFSFSASAEELHDSSGKNCVVYQQRSFLNYSGDDDDDSGLFRDVKSGALHLGVWSLEDAAQLGVIGSLPGYSKVFWPPPSWFWKEKMSQRVGTVLTALENLQIKIPDYKKLEAKLCDLSPRQKNHALEFIQSGIKMKGTLDKGRGIYELLKQMEEVFVAWKKFCKPPNLHNQGGSITLQTEELPESVKMLDNVLEQGNFIVKLLSMESKLHTFVLGFEETTRELEGVVNTSRFSALMDELMEI